MNIKINKPEPVPVTYDLVGLTYDELVALRYFANGQRPATHTAARFLELTKTISKSVSWSFDKAFI
jgi:hypothetical protein